MATYILQGTKLAFKKGTSDKVYTVAICAVDVQPHQVTRHTMCTVEVGWGRRGQELRRMSKTPTAIPYTEATQLLRNIVREKTGKGYQIVGDQTSFGKDTSPKPENIPQVQIVKNRVPKDDEYYQGFVLHIDERDRTGDIHIIDAEQEETVHTIKAKQSPAKTRTEGKRLIDRYQKITAKAQRLLHD